MLPIAMLGGILFHDFIESIQFLAPWLIFVMLFITFCRVSVKEIRINHFSLALLLLQILPAGVAYLALLPFNEIVAQGTFICIFCPTATAAPVITSMLGGSIARVATFSIISNLSVAMLAPVLFTMMNGDAQISFIETLLTISGKVIPLIVSPLILALICGKLCPKFHRSVASHQALSFYIWALSLFIVVGRAVSFVMKASPSEVPLMIVLAIFAGVACCAQFWIGRKVGTRYGDKIAGAQSLGQKNTVLAIWMALTYLIPIASVAPAAYVAWQNTINSAQLYIKSRVKSA